MKKNIYKRIMMVIWIITFLLIIGTAYAYFSSTLYVNGIVNLVGTFDIRFQSATITNMTELESVNISDDGISLAFSVKLALPGESDTITYVITNNGTIDATLDNLVVTSESDSDVTFVCSDISGDLLAGTTKTGTITVTWNENSTSALKDVNFDAYIKANQKV